MDADEQAWVDGLRRGETAAFDAVFAAYRRRLYGYIVRMTRRRDVAEDLLQDTFVRLAQSGKKLAPDTRLGAYLFTVAHRLVVSWARAQAVRTQLAGDLPKSETASPEQSPLEVLADSQAQLALERAFAALPPAYREVALLVGALGLQPTEVAEILGQKPDAIRQRLSRAHPARRSARRARTRIVEDVMTYEDDAAKVTAISRELRAVDLDATTAEQIARRARLEVGRRPSRLRTIEAAVAAIIVIAYFVWAIIKVVEALG